MTVRDLVTFSAKRIQEQERLPEINPELSSKIHDLAAHIVEQQAMDDELVARFLDLLEGVSATHSLRAVAILLDSVHQARVRTVVAQTRAVARRANYYERVCMLAELFAPARVERITETARYIEAGWGW